jgi:membrane protein YdbS with pleckstrin-like domain
MYEFLKRFLFPLLKVEEKEPAPPAGAHDAFQVFRACPAYLAYNLFFWKLYVAALSLGVAVVSVVLLVISSWFSLLVVSIVAVVVFKITVFYATTRLNYDMRWYVITDRSLLIREGVWIVREITLTFANAQNVRITQGPLQRLFGFSNVEVDTAGGGGGGGGPHGEGTRPHRAVLRGLDNAVLVRDLILEHLRRHRTAGLGDPDDHAANHQVLNRALLGEIWDEAKKLRRALAEVKRN